MNEESWYVFCITEGEQPSDLEPGLTVVSNGDLHGVIRPASPDEFACIEPDADGNIPPALAELLLRHDRVIRGLFSRYDLLPMRFGMGVGSPAVFQGYLREQYANLKERLDRVRGHVEWGAKWELLPGAAGADPGAGAPGQRGAGTEAEAARAGRSYLRSRQQALRAEQDRSRRFRSAVERAHKELSALAGAVSPGEGNGEACGCAYLVPRSLEGRFLELAERLRQELAQAGVAMRLTGPWPAYSFTVERTAEEV